MTAARTTSAEPRVVDNEERRLPLWLANEVVDILRGEDFERDEPRFKPNADEPGMTDVIQTARFNCGCVASDDCGWISCGSGLHALLASVSARSSLTDEFRRARAAFDAVLAEAWQQRSAGPDSSIEFQAARQRESITFERWSSQHDLVGTPIWKNGFLHAELRTTPDDEDVRLLTGPNGASISLSWTSERGTVELPFSSEQAARIVFAPI